MLKLHLYWHREMDDFEVGTVYLDVLPPLGALMGCSNPEVDAGVWRVTELMIHPAMEGSMTVRQIRSGHSAPNGQVGIFDVFVEPAEGPFHPGDGEET